MSALKLTHAGKFGLEKPDEALVAVPGIPHKSNFTAYPWFDTKTGQYFLSPRGSQAWNATSIPSKMATGTAYRLFYIRIPILFAAKFDGAAALPGLHLSLTHCGLGYFNEILDEYFSSQL